MTQERLTKKGKLITLLLQQTTTKNLQWSPTETDDTFLVSFPEYSVSISVSYTDEETPPDYYMRMYNREGKIIEEFNDVTIAEENPNMRPSAFQIMQDLYFKARSSALGSDKAIETILKYLNDMPPF